MTNVLLCQQCSSIMSLRVLVCTTISTIYRDQRVVDD